jgi:acyl-CoA synthetase (AMP-forming)/AMP-acid ligase II
MTLEHLAGAPPARLIPHGPRTIADLISDYADGTREALVGLTRCYTYAHLEREVDAAASALLALGLAAGDRVAATGPSDCDLIIVFFATQRCGLVWLGVNRVLAGPEKQFQIADSGAKLALVDAEAMEQVRGGLPGSVRLLCIDGSGPEDWPAHVTSHRGRKRPDVAIDPFAPAAIAYTSGTTGRPKGAVHSQHNLMTVSVACHHLIAKGNWEAGIRRSINVPLTILNAMIYGPFAALVGKGTYICVDRLDVLSIAPVIEEKNVELLGTSATTVYDLLHHPELSGRRLRNLRAVFAGGGFVAEELKEAFRKRYGSELIEDYGLTEAPTSIVSGRIDEAAPPGAVGRAHPHLEIDVFDAAGVSLPRGEVGEVAVRAAEVGPWAGVYSPMLGYWGQPTETAETFRNGWLVTGDLGRIDDGGWVSIVGRKKEVILRGGANVYPAEIERLLRTDDRVEDAVVMGLPDPRLGEIAAAYLLLRRGEEAFDAVKADLMKLCREQLARYKTPERWFVVPAIPRNQMRKPIKSELRDGPRIEI